MFIAAGRLYRSAVILLAASAAALAQQYSITTVAGATPPGTPIPATGLSIGRPARVTVDAAGNLYFSSLNAVFKVAADGALTKVAGTLHPGFSGDGGPAVNAQLNDPQGLAVNSLGFLFIADAGNNRIRVVSPSGAIYTFAGNGAPGTYGSLGDGGAATDANLHIPSGVAVDSVDDVYIADTGNNCIRKVTADGIINRIAGDTYQGYLGDGGAATSAEFRGPEDVAVDSAGNVYIADSGNGMIRKITTDGNINFVAGNKSASIGYFGDGGPATQAGLVEPFSVAVDSSGNVYAVEAAGSRLRKITTDGKINSIAGNHGNGFSGDGGPAAASALNVPTGVAVDSKNSVYIADSLNNRIRKITSSGSGTISTVAGSGVHSYSGDGGQANLAQINGPEGVAVDAAGSLYFSDSNNNVVRKVAANGVITTVAGNGSAGFGGDGAAGVAAQLNMPEGLAVDLAGNLYIADAANNRVRRLAPDGTISTFAGTGAAISTGDGGAAASAGLDVPFGLAADSKGNIYIAEFGGNRVRKVAANGVISTVAGNGVAGYAGDGEQAVNAQLSGPQAVAVDEAGNLYIAENSNYVVRKVTPAGVICTVAGNGSAGFSGDFGAATAAAIGSPSGVAVDAAGNVLITDGGARVRLVYPAGTIVTIAGNGTRGYSGDGGQAASAAMSGVVGIAVDASGKVYIADSGNNAIRALLPHGAALTIGAVTNGASNLPGPISPGEVIVIYGSGLGPSELAPAQLDVFGLFSRNLAGTRVLFNGVPAPIVYTWDTQVAAVVPYSITGSTAQVLVQYQNATTAPVTVPVAQASPALFTMDYTGMGQAAAMNPNGALNGPGFPVKAGDSIYLYLTGAGHTTPDGTDGKLGMDPLPEVALPVTVTIGGQTASATAKQAYGSVAGVILVNAKVPAGVQPGNAVPVEVQVGGAPTQTGVTIAVN